MSLLSRDHESFGRKKETFLLLLNNSYCIVFRLVRFPDSSCRRYYVLSASCRLTFVPTVALLFFSRIFIREQHRETQNRKSANSPGGIYRRSRPLPSGIKLEEVVSNPGHVRGKILESVQALNVYELSGYRLANVFRYVAKISSRLRRTWNFRKKLQDHDFHFIVRFNILLWEKSFHTALKALILTFFFLYKADEKNIERSCKTKILLTALEWK